jgi:archaellum component FlaC
VNNGFDKYDATRKTVDSQVLALTGLIESAKREAGVSQQLIEGVESSVKALRQAEEESRRNLNAVNDQLVAAFETFGNSLVGQVQRVVGETDKNISVLSNQLTGVVQELAQFMQRMRKQ